MKKNVLEISPRYIVDDSGKKTEVILDISTFEKMLESLEDLYFGLQAEQALQKGEFVDFDEVNASTLLSTGKKMILGKRSASKYVKAK